MNGALVLIILDCLFTSILTCSPISYPKSGTQAVVTFHGRVHRITHSRNWYLA